MKKFIEKVEYTGSDAKRIREDSGLSQSQMAEYLGTTKKAVEAWEYGYSVPSGPSCRLLYLLETGQESAFLDSGKHYLHGMSFYSYQIGFTVHIKDDGGQLYITYKKGHHRASRRVESAIPNEPKDYRKHRAIIRKELCRIDRKNEDF